MKNHTGIIHTTHQHFFHWHRVDIQVHFGTRNQELDQLIKITPQINMISILLADFPACTVWELFFFFSFFLEENLRETATKVCSQVLMSTPACNWIHLLQSCHSVMSLGGIMGNVGTRLWTWIRIKTEIPLLHLFWSFVHEESESSAEVGGLLFQNLVLTLPTMQLSHKSQH